ncbi:MAG: hypothetical protein KTR14_06150 [Vampirovibrio sp.]|nr:hypothetical protein [Vampirovibrio sp.]
MSQPKHMQAQQPLKRYDRYDANNNGRTAAKVDNKNASAIKAAIQRAYFWKKSIIQPFYPL